LGGGGENQADLGGRGEDEAKLGGGGEDEADLGGESEDEVVLGSGCQTEGEFGGRGEPDLRGGGEDEFGGGGEADLGGGGGQEGVFETEVYIKAEVHSWDDSENENEDFVNIPVSVMGDINNCDNDVGSVVDEVGIIEEENQSECQQRGNVRKHIDRGLSDDQWQLDELLSGRETNCELEDDDSSRDVFGMFLMLKYIADYKWDMGTYFLDKEHFRDVVKTYAVHGGRNIRFVHG